MRGKADLSTTPQNVGMIHALFWVVYSFALECIWLVTDECYYMLKRCGQVGCFFTQHCVSSRYFVWYVPYSHQDPIQIYEAKMKKSVKAASFKPLLKC